MINAILKRKFFLILLLAAGFLQFSAANSFVMAHHMDFADCGATMVCASCAVPLNEPFPEQIQTWSFEKILLCGVPQVLESHPVSIYHPPR